jgi:hypothetical protein
VYIRFIRNLTKQWVIIIDIDTDVMDILIHILTHITVGVGVVDGMIHTIVTDFHLMDFLS